jgi:hypothetical protein
MLWTANAQGATTMNDEFDDSEHDKHLKEHIAKIKKELSDSMNGIMAGLMENMAPAMSAISMVQDESKAWDEFVVAALPLVNTPGARMSIAMEMADELIRERRKRFDARTIQDRVRAMMPGAQNQCGKPVASGACPREAGHDGPCV